MLKIKLNPFAEECDTFNGVELQWWWMLAPEEVTLNHVTTSTIVVLLIEVPPDRILYFLIELDGIFIRRQKRTASSSLTQCPDTMVLTLVPA